MAGMTVVFPGALASLQDKGRSGLRRAGVPLSGALEPAWLRLANALAGNAEKGPAIEFFGGGLQLKAEEVPVLLGLAGFFTADVIGRDGSRRSVTSWRSLVLAPGEQLRCGMTTQGRLAYVAVSGLQAPRLLGSASTYARAGIGRLLAAGDRLEVAAAAAVPAQGLAILPEYDTLPVRVVLGPQADYFDEAALAMFAANEYRVTAESDRMGMRLDGPPLSHRPDKGVEIISDATVPGSIQVPGNGKPIVLLNDGQTAGGYPKIATVISADLPRIAVLSAGQSVRFRVVGVDEAEQAARAREAAIRQQIASISTVFEAGQIDLEAIYAANLVSGIVDAQAEEVRPLLMNVCHAQ
ncbi:MAG: biotin-dependent carboxyltransferase family protein [Zoogloeaceae bacterium]|nr:biotin-dependent carboxyltransferase family protein [Zoogloeaceae bacterium]